MVQQLHSFMPHYVVRLTSCESFFPVTLWLTILHVQKSQNKAPKMIHLHVSHVQNMTWFKLHHWPIGNCHGDLQGIQLRGGWDWVQREGGGFWWRRGESRHDAIVPLPVGCKHAVETPTSLKKSLCSFLGMLLEVMQWVMVEKSKSHWIAQFQKILLVWLSCILVHWLRFCISETMRYDNCRCWNKWRPNILTSWKRNHNIHHNWLSICYAKQAVHNHRLRNSRAFPKPDHAWASKGARLTPYWEDYWKRTFAREGIYHHIQQDQMVFAEFEDNPNSRPHCCWVLQHGSTLEVFTRKRTHLSLLWRVDWIRRGCLWVAAVELEYEQTHSMENGPWSAFLPHQDKKIEGLELLVKNLTFEVRACASCLIFEWQPEHTCGRSILPFTRALQPVQ